MDNSANIVYMVVRDRDTGEMIMITVPADHPNPQMYLSEQYQNTGKSYELVDWDGTGMFTPINPDDPQAMAQAGMFINSGDRGENVPPLVDPATQQPRLSPTQQSTQEQRKTDYNLSQPDPQRQGSTVYVGGNQVHQSPIGNNLVTALDPNGQPLTNEQVRTGNQKTQAELEAQGLPTTDVYGRPVTTPGVTPLSLPQINDRAGYTPGMYTQSTGISAPDQSNGLGAPVNPVSPIKQVPGQTDNGLPYNMTDDVALQSLINKSAGDDAFARLYNDQGGYGNSFHADFANRNYGLYDDIYALQNPGMPGLDPNQQYANASQYLDAMGMPTNNGEIAALDGRGLWDNQFVDEYMTSERGMGSGDDWAARSQSQYEQVVTNIAALQPAMGTRNAQSILNMVDRSYEDYKQLTLTGDPTVQNMNFVQYLQSIGAEEWF